MGKSRLNHFLYLLLATDFLFIILTFLDKFTGFNLGGSVDAEGGTAEKYQYLKYFWITLITLSIGLRRRSIVYYLLSILPAYLLLDDSNSIHETFGSKFSSLIHKGSSNDIIIQNFRYQDVGEISYMVFAALLAFILFKIILNYSSQFEKFFLVKIKKIILVFLFFAILIDGLHQLFNGIAYKLISIIEDGGEMVLISILCSNFYNEVLNEKYNKKVI